MMSEIHTSSSTDVILVVDDQQVHLKLMERILRQKGWEVDTAASRDAAFNAIAKRMPSLILLDVVLPDYSGFDICKEIKLLPGTELLPVIFMSSINDAQTKVRAFDEGGADYITKPFSKEEVLARCELHLKMRQFNLNKTRYIGKLEKEREDYIARLEALNKEKDTMLSIVSHDLRSPLGGIKVMAELLSDPDYCDSLDSIKEYAGQITKTVDFMTGLVNNLLDVSRIESGQTTALNCGPVDIPTLFEDIAQTLKGSALAKNIAIEIKTPDSLPAIEGDTDKLAQVVVNLVNNAIKFTPENGKITLAAEFDADNKKMLLTFSDTGIGVPTEKLPTLFDKGGMTQRKGTSGERGVGLGLPLVHAFVTMHNGTISVESTVGEGTTFYIILPQLQPETDS